MIIGVDGGALYQQDKRLQVGVFKVNQRLLENLSHLDYSNNYRIYTFNSRGEGSHFKYGSKFESRVVKPAFGWQKIWLPLELWRNQPDLFLGLSQSVPWITSDIKYKINLNVAQYSPISKTNLFKNNRNIYQTNNSLTQTRRIGFVYDLGFIHEPASYPGSANKLKKQTDFLAFHSDFIVTISKSTKNDLVDKYNLNSDIIKIVYPGVDDIFQPFGKVYPTNYPYFLFVGALKPGKNIPFLINSFAQFLKNTKSDSRLILAGSDYWYDKEIDVTISKFGLEKHVIKKGFVTDSDLAQLYRGAIAFVSPSLWEGFCLPALEAMACGCPVIGSTNGAFKEVTGTAGIVVNPKKSIDLTQALIDINDNQIKRTYMKQSGLVRAKKFSWSKMASEVLKIINQFNLENL